MTGEIITILIFLVVQIGSGLIFLTKLRDGQEGIQRDLGDLGHSVSELAKSIAAINLSDVRWEEKNTQLRADVSVCMNRLSQQDDAIQALRRRYHNISGFVMATFPEWREISKQYDE